MKNSIEIYNNDKLIFSSDDATFVPNEKDELIINGRWYIVRSRNFIYDSITKDDVSCTANIQVDNFDQYNDTK